MFWIGIDDTDSTTGGCTTYIMYRLMQELQKKHCKIVGHPHLVRLNPNIPWKTRGNGALSLKVEEAKNIPIYQIVSRVIENYAHIEDPKTNPGFVISRKKPTCKLYLKTVREILKVDEIESVLKLLDAEYKGYKNRRGLIGATAAIAWSPRLDKTYELITYRERKRWGTERFVDDVSVMKMDKTYPTTFDNYDYKNYHNRLVPSSPCPVLYGIRGEKPNELIQAQKTIISEPVDSWMIFETNQGTDDHLMEKNIEDAKPFESVIVEGKISKNPIVIKGGHVIFNLESNNHIIDCAAYEPTKQFREIVRQLSRGDAVRVYGGVREQPLTINIEKMKVNHLVKVFEKIENPVCPSCRKHMKSIGDRQGYRCRSCGTKVTEDKARFKEKKRVIKPGFYEVPVCARRHLSMPLKRLKP
ncbi:DNA-binding protein [Thermoplasmatales archaeon SCGC AB-539-N05]|nr:DNA-binding protein [Thermoplasmatales archaeon SCGC AB-539-N05]